MTNRIKQFQPDFVFLLVRKPKNWRPRNYFDVPPRGVVVSRTLVASYPEAHDDLVRCNRIALHGKLDTWAVIKSADELQEYSQD